MSQILGTNLFTRSILCRTPATEKLAYCLLLPSNTFTPVNSRFIVRCKQRAKCILVINSSVLTTCNIPPCCFWRSCMKITCYSGLTQGGRPLEGRLPFFSLVYSLFAGLLIDDMTGKGRTDTSSK